MAVKHPLGYELEPQHLATGRRWVSLRLKNVSDETLTGLSVMLQSQDTYDIGVNGGEKYVLRLAPLEEERLSFRVQAKSTNSIYITVDGLRDGDPFHWETPLIWTRVGENVAELVSLFATTEPYLQQHQAIRCEATVRTLAACGPLQIEFWAATPGGAFQELTIIETGVLDEGHVMHYIAEVDADERGAYTLYAYLYEGAKRIGRQIEHLSVT